MFDWLKLFLFAEWFDHKPSEVCGPVFSARKRNCLLGVGDNNLHFSAPEAKAAFNCTEVNRLMPYHPGLPMYSRQNGRMILPMRHTREKKRFFIGIPGILLSPG